MRINISLPRIAIFFYFLSYGYYGSFSPKSSQYNFFWISSIIALFLAIPFFYYKFLDSEIKKTLTFQLNLEKSDFINFVIFFILLGALVFPQLNFWLYSDEISYVASAHGHSIQIGLWLINKSPFFDSFQFKWLIQLFSIFLLVFIYILWKLTTPDCTNLKIFSILLLFLFFRLAFYIKGGNGNPHPPMELFPLLISGAIIGITSITFKITVFTIYIIFMCVLCRILMKKLNQISSCIVVLIVSTIPVVLNLIYTVEHSTWGYIFTSLVMLHLLTNEKPKLEYLIYIVAIGSLFRQPLFILSVVIIYLYLIGKYKEPEFKFISILKFLIPTIIFIPIILNSIFLGTEAHQFALKNITSSLQFWDAIVRGSILNYFINSYGLIWIIPVLFSFYFIEKNLRIALIIFLLILIIVFYSIRPEFWGMKKYQVELYAPFILLGCASFFIRFNNVKYGKFTLIIIGSILIFVNVVTFKMFPTVQLTNNFIKNDTLHVLPYEYKDVCEFIKIKQMQLNTLSIGSTYGILTEIMCGYTGTQVVATKKIYDKHKFIIDSSLSPSEKAKVITGDHLIKLIIIQDNLEYQSLIKILPQYQWKMIEIYSNNLYKTNLYIFER
jgi:hypothetical protein